MTTIKISGRSLGNQYRQFTEFLASVKSGKESLIIGKDYVVMDRKTYDELNRGFNTKFKSREPKFKQPKKPKYIQHINKLPEDVRQSLLEGSWDINCRKCSKPVGDPKDKNNCQCYNKHDKTKISSLGGTWDEKTNSYIFKSGARIYFHHYKHGKTKVNTMKGLTLENLK